MRKHPTLKEALAERPSDEWLTVNISGFTLGDFPSWENSLGEISNPSFCFILGPSESDLGTVSFNRGIVSLNRVAADSIQNLEGEKPFGSINYYDSEYAAINLNVNESLYDNLVSLLNDLHCLSLRVSIPLVEDREVKCLPLLSYQLVYEKDIGEI